jgi:hypothetical protein
MPRHISSHAFKTNNIPTHTNNLQIDYSFKEPVNNRRIYVTWQLNLHVCNLNKPKLDKFVDSKIFEKLELEIIKKNSNNHTTTTTTTLVC